MLRVFSPLILAFSMLTAPALAQTPLPAAERQLLDDFRAAHQARDLAAIEKLIHWQGVEPAMREAVRNSIRRDLAQPLASVALNDPPAGEKYEYKMNGKLYRANLPVEKTLVIDLDAAGAESAARTRYPVGRLNQRYLITIATPATTPTP